MILLPRLEKPVTLHVKKRILGKIPYQQHVDRTFRKRSIFEELALVLPLTDGEDSNDAVLLIASIFSEVHARYRR